MAISGTRGIASAKTKGEGYNQQEENCQGCKERILQEGEAPKQRAVGRQKMHHEKDANRKEMQDTKINGLAGNQRKCR